VESSNKYQSHERQPCTHVKAVMWAITALLTLSILIGAILSAEKSRLQAEQDVLRFEIRKLNEDVVVGRVATAEIRQQYSAIRASLDRIEQRLYGGGMGSKPENY